MFKGSSLFWTSKIINSKATKTFESVSIKKWTRKLLRQAIDINDIILQGKE